ncbi:clathrin heavy chain [Aureococcus anophagefferens]|uniref:Clathrin heavy chain n=1 Tax=Aureococcus anophagefferens TaxID=44056 RepID=A0ABR1FQN3_AURAN
MARLLGALGVPVPDAWATDELVKLTPEDLRDLLVNFDELNARAAPGPGLPAGHARQRGAGALRALRGDGAPEPEGGRRAPRPVHLPSLGVSAGSIKFGFGSPQVFIVDLASGSPPQVTKRPMSAEAAIMNPVSKVLALRAGTQLQIFNLELRAKMKSHNMTETVVFWRWTSPNNIALVADGGVPLVHRGHVGARQGARPPRVLGEGTQVINYQVSPDEKWCLLMGISQAAGGVIQGNMQLYSVEKKVSQTLQGHAGCFHSMAVPGRSDPAQVLIFEEKKADQPAKLFVMEVGRDKDAPGGVFRLAPVAIPVPADAPNDFPVSMVPSPKHDVVYMVTKMGYLYLFDCLSGKALSTARITTDTVFVTCGVSATGGLLGITARKGQLLQVSLNEQTLVPYVNDVNMALSVYLRANVPEKAINCFLRDKTCDREQKVRFNVGYRCDYSFMLGNLVRANPPGALDFAKQLAAGSLVDPNSVVEIFMAANRIQETTAFLLEALKGNKPEEGYLQTKLLEEGGSPQVATILQNAMFTPTTAVPVIFNPTSISLVDLHTGQYVAKLCEAAGLSQRALEHYTDVDDIKRSLLAMCANPQALNPEFVLSYFGSLSPEASLECLKELLARNMRGNMQIVTQVAAKYNEQIGAQPLVDLFESFKCYEGLFYYLGQIVNFSQDATVHYKYIEAAAKCQQYKEVERVCRDSTVYEPQPVKEFLMEMKLPDPRPLIHVCDRHDFIEEMTAYLYGNNLQKYIEVYCNKVSPQKTPMVVGKLLDLDCNEDFVRGLLNSVGHACPVEELVEQVEHRNRLRLLQPWLEARIATGNQETGTHNAIGKIYVTLNRDPVSFLTNDQYYDPRVLGKYCEKLDPSLAFLAYKRAGGECDADLIRVTTENGLFKDQARYLVEKQDLELWASVLTPPAEENVGDASEANRRALIDQVVQTALPETRDPDHVSTSVKAFMAADLPHELIELLERIVLQGSDFSENKNLQNLLILTAIKADKERVMEYVNRLDNFDGPEIAKIAVSDQYNLYEEGFVIYTKFAKAAPDAAAAVELNVAAVGVLVDLARNLERASEFAERVNEAGVWSRLAKAQLAEDLIAAAVASFIKAGDATCYGEVIAAAEREDSYETLVPFLAMARKHVKEAQLDTMLIYAYAKSNMLGDLEEFIAAPNVASIQSIGERCFDEGLFSAAKLLFASINNNAKLALCYVNLEMYREAVDAAHKANSVSTWKEVNRVCVQVGEFRLARVAGLQIIVHPDHLEELTLLYERAGQPMELIQLMEQGLGLDAAHSGIFTELGVLYSKYVPAKLMEHIKIFWSRMNTPKLMRACEKALLWDEAVFLLKEDEQHDSARISARGVPATRQNSRARSHRRRFG